MDNQSALGDEREMEIGVREIGDREIGVRVRIVKSLFLQKS